MHSPLLAHPFCECSRFWQTRVSPNASLIPTPVRKHSMSSGSHNPKCGSLCAAPHLGTPAPGGNTSYQLIGCDAGGEQQGLLLLIQGLSPVLKNIHASFMNPFFQVSLCFPGYSLVWLTVIIFNMMSFGQTPSQTAPSQRALGVPLTNTVYIYISVLTSVVIQTTGEPCGHSTPV